MYCRSAFRQASGKHCSADSALLAEVSTTATIASIHAGGWVHVANVSRYMCFDMHHKSKNSVKPAAASQLDRVDVSC